MQDKLENLLSALLDEADTSNNVDAVIGKYSQKIRSRYEERWANIPPYAVQVCVEIGTHNLNCDEDGYCCACHDQWVPEE